MKVKEKRHRFPKEFYKGEVSVAFTLCLKAGVAEVPEAFGISLREPEVVGIFVDILSSVVANTACIIPVYCFMPDHQHLIIMGMQRDSDIWKTIISYKQKTGFWMSQAKVNMTWQKDFYDHVIRRHEDMVTQAKYILDNPVRKGLVSEWQDYPYKGSIGCRMDDVLNGII